MGALISVPFERDGSAVCEIDKDLGPFARRKAQGPQLARPLEKAASEAIQWNWSIIPRTRDHRSVRSSRSPGGAEPAGAAREPPNWRSVDQQRVTPPYVHERHHSLGKDEPAALELPVAQYQEQVIDADSDSSPRVFVSLSVASRSPGCRHRPALPCGHACASGTRGSIRERQPEPRLDLRNLKEGRLPIFLLTGVQPQFRAHPSAYLPKH